MNETEQNHRFSFMDVKMGQSQKGRVTNEKEGHIVDILVSFGGFRVEVGSKYRLRYSEGAEFVAGER